MQSWAVSPRLLAFIMGLHGAEVPWKTDRYLERLLPFSPDCAEGGSALSRAINGALEEPAFPRRPQAEEPTPCCSLAVCNSWCLGLAFRARLPGVERAAQPEPRASRPAIRPFRPLLLPSSFRTDRYIWSGKATGAGRREADGDITVEPRF